MDKLSMKLNFRHCGGLDKTQLDVRVLNFNTRQQPNSKQKTFYFWQK